MFKVMCPKCKNRMRYQPRTELKKKACVYCGHTFTVSKAYFEKV